MEADLNSETDSDYLLVSPRFVRKNNLHISPHRLSRLMRDVEKSPKFNISQKTEALKQKLIENATREKMQTHEPLGGGLEEKWAKTNRTVENLIEVISHKIKEVPEDELEEENNLWQDGQNRNTRSFYEDRVATGTPQKTKEILSNSERRLSSSLQNLNKSVIDITNSQSEQMREGSNYLDEALDELYLLKEQEMRTESERRQWLHIFEQKLDHLKNSFEWEANEFDSKVIQKDHIVGRVSNRLNSFHSPNDRNNTLRKNRPFLAEENIKEGNDFDRMEFSEIMKNIEDGETRRTPNREVLSTRSPLRFENTKMISDEPHPKKRISFSPNRFYSLPNPKPKPPVDIYLLQRKKIRHLERFLLEEQEKWRKFKSKAREEGKETGKARDEIGVRYHQTLRENKFTRSPRRSDTNGDQDL